MGASLTSSHNCCTEEMDFEFRDKSKIYFQIITKTTIRFVFRVNSMTLPKGNVAFAPLNTLRSARKKIFSNHRYDELRKSLKIRLTKSLRKYREQSGYNWKYSRTFLARNSAPQRNIKSATEGLSRVGLESRLIFFVRNYE